MNIVSALFRNSSPTVEQRSEVTSDELLDLLADKQTATGRRLPVEKALTQTTVFSCVNLISETAGTLPMVVFRRLAGRGKERAVKHPCYTLLHDLANPELTAQELLENMVGHIALWGNAYCEIEYDRAGRRKALWPLRPDRMTVDVDGNERTYVYTLPDGEPKPLPRYRVWHVRGWGTDAWVGLSRIALAREAIALALATEEYGARFFGNDSRPGGVLKHPGKLSKDGQERLKSSWESAHKGLTNAQRVAVLEEGVEWQSIGIPPNDAQFLETRAFQDVKLCGIYRVPPPMVGILEGSTTWGTGLAEQKAWLKTFAVQPYLTRLAKSAYRDLLSVAERTEYFAEFVTAAYEQANLDTRYSAYNIGRQGGWLSVNDIRELENMNPVADGDGYLQPLNMGPLGSEPDTNDSSQNGNDKNDDSQNGNDGGDDGTQTSN